MRAPTYPGRDNFQPKSRRETQCSKVLSFLETHGSITPRDAMTFGCYRLAARIKDLRDRGYAIETRREKHEGGTHARYSLLNPTEHRRIPCPPTNLSVTS